MTVAALYVETGGAYFDVEGVDPWDEKRDAREYAGPHPVIAHPPCNWWCMPLCKVNRTRYGHPIGRDAGTFAHALWAVRTFGGVLEHPANSSAFEFFGIEKPSRGCWTYNAPEWRWGTGKHTWVTQVAQSAYGHDAVKRTWLIYSGYDHPPPMLWNEEAPKAVTSWLQRTETELPRISKKSAKQTPVPFRDAMIELAHLSAVGGPP